MTTCDNTDERLKRAGWEFIQFLITDEHDRPQRHQDRLPAHHQGHLRERRPWPTFWAENPSCTRWPTSSCPARVSEAYPYFENRSRVHAPTCQSVISLMVQEGSITAEQAVERIKLENAHLFENGF